jgi:PKD-like domain/Secretion system C-terminal sorting domain
MNPIISNKLKIAFLILFSITEFSQAQLIKQWDYRFGGTAIDEFHDVISTDDGGYLLAGYSESGISGDKTTASQGSGDFWIIKISSTGVKQWEKDFGGTSYDELFEAQQTKDGGYILGGWSNSGISGNKTQASFGAGDYWIVKTDASGNIQWDRTFGGSSEDYLQSIKQTSDSGFILAGRSNSGISGSKTQANRGTIGVTWDYWVVKINKLGTKQWDQTYGGVDDDQLVSAQQTSDGGYLFGGYSTSGISGEKSQASQGLDDYWMVKTDANGVKQWDKSFGGTNADQTQMMLQTSDGGYILGGASASGANGDKSQGSRGNFDYWIVKTNASGVKQWDKRFGGSSADILFDLIQTSDGGYLLGGASSSAAGGDKSQGNQGTVGSSYDYWAVKIDALGIAQVDKRFGGSADDYAKSICETSDGGYMITGWSTSGATGDKSQASQGSIDYWITKVSGPNSITTLPVGSPQCAGASINVDYTLTGTFNAGNTFTAFLSDASGSFASPTNIGSISSTTGGIISAVLPFSTPAGSQYQIQVTSSNPISTVYPNTAFQINTPTLYFLDFDNDTYGDAGNSQYSCTPLGGYVTNNNDCNDNDPLVHQLPDAASGIAALSSNCEGSTGNIFDANKITHATTYQWYLSAGLSSTAPGNQTTDTLLSIAIALGTANGTVKVIGENSCGTGDTAFYAFAVARLPQAAGIITGDTLISACLNQTGINYSVDSIAYATSYVWSVPDSATIISGAGTNSITVNFSTLSSSGNVIVNGVNACGAGPSSTLAVTFNSVPTTEICYVTVDSATSHCQLFWQRPVETYVDSFVIYSDPIGGSNLNRIAAIKNTAAISTTYLDLFSNPIINAVTYQIATKDSCNNQLSLSAAVVHKTINLNGTLGWSGAAKLYWNEYLGISDPGRYYSLLRDTIGTGPFDDTLATNIAPAATMNFTDVTSFNYASCRYLVAMNFNTNCDPTQRILLNKSTSRSNIKNRAAMGPDAIKENDAFDFSVAIYPNPSNGNITVNMLHSTANSTLQLFNMVGEEVWQEKVMEVKSGDILVIPTAELPRGIYTLKISGKNAAAIKKIVLN